MTKADIAKAIARQGETTKIRAGVCVDAIIDALKEGLLDVGRIEIRGLGVFIVRARKRGVGRNPKTGQTIPIQPGRTIRFKPGKDLHLAAVDPRTAEPR